MSQYNYPILLVHKNTGALRVFIDYKSLNSNTIVDTYPIPRINNALGRLRYEGIFIKTDLTSSYHQVKMHPDYCQKAALKN